MIRISITPAAYSALAQATGAAFGQPFRHEGPLGGRFAWLD
jgi:hypothetical protein